MKQLPPLGQIRNIILVFTLCNLVISASGQKGVRNGGGRARNGNGNGNGNGDYFYNAYEDYDYGAEEYDCKLSHASTYIFLDNLAELNYLSS